MSMVPYHTYLVKLALTGLPHVAQGYFQWGPGLSATSPLSDSKMDRYKKDLRGARPRRATEMGPDHSNCCLIYLP